MHRITTKKSIAVLLTVFNRKEQTLQCLSNLFAQTIPYGYNLDVFLTNDGCTDGTLEAVSTQFPQVIIINGNGNLFWNRGMYVAWDRAAKEKDYDYYLWLNDDTFAYDFMLVSLLNAAIETNSKAIIVGVTQSTDKTHSTYGGRLPNGQLPKPCGKLQQIRYFNGNIVLVPKSVYMTLGNLDYYFTHSKGDFDYGMRANKAGIKMYQVGEYLGECDLHPTLDKWCDPTIPFTQRWKMLHRPNGMPPKEIYHLNLRHRGLASAIVHYFTVYLRCVFPQLWNKRNQKYLSRNNR